MAEYIKHRIMFIKVVYLCFIGCSKSALLPEGYFDDDIIEPPKDIRVQCNSDGIIIAVDTEQKSFQGMIYPMGLSKNSSCMVEYGSGDQDTLEYKLPLRACNTMSTQLDDGMIEYFNTVVVQPHKKLVTDKGRGFHVKCRYQSKKKSGPNTSVTESSEVDLKQLPSCTMKIYNGDVVQSEIAENVKIGDPLTISITMDNPETHGLYVTDCTVQDGLGWSHQNLIDSDGCPVDPEIMGTFKYNKELTKAEVHFQAHKFPYTESVYYHCSVHFCQRSKGECNNLVPPVCDNPEKKKRNKRNDKLDEDKKEGSQAMIEVYSGLYVNEANDLNSLEKRDSEARKEAMEDPYKLCVSQKNFAIGISVAGIFLMLLTVIVVLFILTRKHKSGKNISSADSSIYSGPYTNTAYSHTS